MKNFLDVAVVTVILLLTTVQEAQAYIDPGSGSLIMTAILGFFAAIGYTSRKYFYRFKSLFKKKPETEAGHVSEPNEEYRTP